MFDVHGFAVKIHFRRAVFFFFLSFFGNHLAAVIYVCLAAFVADNIQI